MKSERPGTSVSLDHSLNAVSLAPTCDRVAVGGKDVFRILRLSEEGLAEERFVRGSRAKYDLSTNDLEWNPHKAFSKWIATAATNGNVILWNVERAGRSTAKELSFSEHARMVHRVSWHPNDPTLLLSASQDGTVRHWDVRDRNSIRLDLKSEVRDAVFRPSDPRFVACAAGNGVVQIFDMRTTKRPWAMLTAHVSTVMAVDWHPSRPDLLATGGIDRTIKTWSVSGNTLLAEPEHTIQTTGTVSRLRWQPGNPSAGCWGLIEEREAVRVPHLRLTSTCTWGARRADIIAHTALLDSTVHLWDIRRLSIPAARIRTHTEAAGGLCWCADPLLVSAAARVSSTAETSRQEPPGRADSLSSALLRSSALAEMRSRAPKHLWSHLVTCGRDGKVALYTVGTAEPPMARLRLAAHAVHPTSAEVAFVSQSQPRHSALVPPSAPDFAPFHPFRDGGVSDAVTVATSDRAAEEALHPPHVAALRALAARGESLTHESAPRAREAAKRAAALCREAARSRRVFGQDARHTRYLAQYSLLGGSSLATLCKHNASVHRAVGLHAEAQTWLILERIFTPLAVPNTVRAGARELVGGGSTQFLRHAPSLDALRGSGRDTGSQPAGRGRSVPGRSPGSTPAPGTAGDEAALAPEGAVAADSEAIAHAGRGAEARLPHPHPHRARTASSHGTGRRQAPARRTRGRATSAFGPSVPDSVNRLVTAMEDEASLGRSAADPPGSRPLRRRRGLRAEDVAPGGPAQAEEEVSVAETSVRPDSPAQVPAVAAAGTSAPTTFPGLGVSADAEGKGPGEEDAGAASHVDAALQAATERYKRVAGAGGGEGQGEGEGGGGGGGGERSAGLRRVNGTSPTAGGEDGGESSDFYDSTSPVGPGDLWEDSGDSDVADTAVELADEMQQAGIVAGGSVLHAIPVPVSAIPGNGEGRSEVQDALSMTSALDWGGEDGTTFSRAGGPSQTLRQSGRVEAVGGPSASAAEDGGLRGRERELDAAVRDTLAVHEEEERRALAWLREGVVTDLVEFLLQQGDVQMCAHVLTVLGPARTPTVSRRQRQGVLVSYIDLLHRLGEYVTATEVLKYCEDAGLQEMNQKATSVALSCCRCGKGLDPSERDRCSGCRAALTTCTVTGTRIKGLYAWNPVQPEAGSLWHCLDKVQETS